MARIGTITIVTMNMTVSSRARAVTGSGHDHARLRRDVGGVLRRERYRAGLTQAAAAALAGMTVDGLCQIETGRFPPSESSTRRLAQAFRPGGDPVEVALLDLELQRAAGESLRRWNRRRAWSEKRQRAYAEAARLLDAQARPSLAERAELGRVLAALADPWEPNELLPGALHDPHHWLRDPGPDHDGDDHCDD